MDLRDAGGCFVLAAGAAGVMFVFWVFIKGYALWAVASPTRKGPFEDDQKNEALSRWLEARGSALSSAFAVLERCHAQQAGLSSIFRKKPVESDVPAALEALCDAYLAGDEEDCQQIRYFYDNHWRIPFLDFARRCVAGIGAAQTDREAKMLLLRRGIAAMAVTGVDFRDNEDLYLKLYQAGDRAGLDPKPVFIELAGRISPEGRLGFVTGIPGIETPSKSGA